MPGEAIWKKLKLITVEPIAFLYPLIIFIESNAIQNLIYVKSCIGELNLLNDTGPIDIRNCSIHFKDKFSDQITADAIYWIRFNSIFLFLFQFCSCLFVASWSDQFGRKFPMLIPPIGTIFAASINCLLSAFIETSPAFLFISSTISGLTFGVVGITSTTFGYVSDISDLSSRTKRMMILEVMLFSGATVGTYIAGAFLKYPDYDLKVNGFTKLFAFEVLVACLIVFYTLFRIPNRMNDGTETGSLTLKNLFSLDHAYDWFKAVIRPRERRNRATLLLLLLSLVLISSVIAVMSILSYPFLNKMGWDFYKFSVFNSSLFGVEGAVLIAMPILLYCFQIPDHFIALLGILSKMAGVLLFGLSKNDAMVFGSLALFMFSEYPVPAIRSIISKVVDPNEVGKIFAVTAILPNFCFLIGSMTLTSIFEATHLFFPGLCFICVAGLQLIAFFIMVYLYSMREEVVTTYHIMEEDDGSVTETCVIAKHSASINS